MRNLRSFVFTSTYWVNNFMPYNTPVKEEVHHPTLQLAGGDCCQEALKGCMLTMCNRRSCWCTRLPWGSMHPYYAKGYVNTPVTVQ